MAISRRIGGVDPLVRPGTDIGGLREMQRGRGFGGGLSRFFARTEPMSGLLGRAREQQADAIANYRDAYQDRGARAAIIGAFSMANGIGMTNQSREKIREGMRHAGADPNDFAPFDPEAALAASRLQTASEIGDPAAFGEQWGEQIRQRYGRR